MKRFGANRLALASCLLAASGRRLRTRVAGAGGRRPSRRRPAKVDSPKPEAELATVTLSPEAREASRDPDDEGARSQPVALSRTVGGETIVPPGKSVQVTAPIAGILTRRPRGGDRAGAPRRRHLRARCRCSRRSATCARKRSAPLQEADARLTQTTQRAQRLEQLLKEGSASARSVEEAQADRAVAAAAAEAARKRLESVSRLPVGPRGEMALTRAVRRASSPSCAPRPDRRSPPARPSRTSRRPARLWIRAPVYVGDLSSLDTSQPAMVAALGQETSGPWRAARRVTGPPAANRERRQRRSVLRAAGRRESADCGLANGSRSALPLKATERALVVPAVGRRLRRERRHLGLRAARAASVRAAARRARRTRRRQRHRRARARPTA